MKVVIFFVCLWQQSQVQTGLCGVDTIGISIDKDTVVPTKLQMRFDLPKKERANENCRYIQDTI